MTSMHARKAALYAVVFGALALSFAGQSAVTRPLLGDRLAATYAVTLDVATLLALHEAVSHPRRAVRRWAWAVLLIAGGIALGLNLSHAITSDLLPVPVAIAVGAGPVVLAGLLSHLVAIVGNPAPRTDSGPAGDTRPRTEASYDEAPVIAGQPYAPADLATASPGDTVRDMDVRTGSPAASRPRTDITGRSARTAARQLARTPAASAEDVRALRDRARTDLLDRLYADPAYRPDYPALAATYGVSRSWLEKRWAEARAELADRTETVA